MLAKVSYGFRWLATAFSFFIFGIGGILLPLIVPIIYLFPGDENIREKRGQRLIHNAFRGFIWMMKVLGVLTFSVSDIERLREAKLILANHPSLLDVVFLISLVPNANCVIKSSLLMNPFMRGPIKAAGYIVNAGNEAGVIEAATGAFDKGHALIVFPEGTRTTPLKKIKLKRGAANIAIRSGVDITPVIISCVPTTLTKRDRWYQIPSRPMHYKIMVKDMIEIAAYLNNLHPAKGARVLTDDLTRYFNNEAFSE